MTATRINHRSPKSIAEFGRATPGNRLIHWAVIQKTARSRCIDLAIDYTTIKTPFGETFIAMTHLGICYLAFPERGRDHPLAFLRKTWPFATLQENHARIAEVADHLFRHKKEMHLHVFGTDFQIRVWKALLRIPYATCVSYSEIAADIGYPKAARAVGLAVGANPVAFLIPCHRVIRKNGHLGGYHWGSACKQMILKWELQQQRSMDSSTRCRFVNPI